MSRLAMVVLSLLLGLLVGCQTTHVETVWKTSDPLPPRFSRVVTLVVNATPAERRVGEEEMARQLGPGRGVAGYTIINDEAFKDREKVKQVLQAQGVDGAVVFRLISKDRNTTYYPPTYQSNYSFNDYYDGFVTYSPGYDVTSTTVRTEISVYSVKDARLLWAGSSTTDNPSSIKDLVTQIVKATSTELKKQEMLQ